MEIKIALTPFFSQGDEERFFVGLKRIKAVGELRGVGTELILSIDASKLDRPSMTELLAVFRRYGISRKPLRPLAKLEKFSWLKEGGWKGIMADRSVD